MTLESPYNESNLPIRSSDWGCSTECLLTTNQRSTVCHCRLSVTATTLFYCRRPSTDARRQAATQSAQLFNSNWPECRATRAVTSTASASRLNVCLSEGVVPKWFARPGCWVLTETSASSAGAPAPGGGASCQSTVTQNELYCSWRLYAEMLSPRGQRGLEAKFFCLGLILVLIQCWPRSRSRRLSSWPIVVSHRNHVIYVRFFSDRKLLLAL